MRVPIRYGDPILLYNSELSIFVSKPDLRFGADGGLTGFPMSTHLASEAGLFIIEWPDKAGKEIKQNSPFRLRTSSNRVVDELWLSATGTSTGTAPPLEFAKSNLFATSWDSVPPGLDPVKTQEPLLYGHRYPIRHRFNGMYMVVSETKDLTVQDGTDLGSDQWAVWVFVPTFPIYTCQRAVDICFESRGLQNSYGPPICSSGSCFNPQSEQVFDSAQECRSSCGLNLRAPGLDAVQVQNLSEPRSSPVLSAAAIVILLLSLVLLIGILKK